MGKGNGLIVTNVTELVRIQPSDKPDTIGNATGFGRSVACTQHDDGASYLAVGAPYHDACDNPGNDNTGAVYIYKNVNDMDDVCDNHLVKLQPSDKPDANVSATWFGWSVAWTQHDDGASYLAVGAPEHDACDGRADNTGAVYVYEDIELM